MAKIIKKASLKILILSTIAAALFVLMYYFWISNYFTEVGSTANFENSFAPSIERIDENNLYFTNLNSKDLFVIKMELEGKLCLENQSFPNGKNKIDISPCLEGLSIGTYDLVINTAQKNFTTKVYVS